MSTWTNISDTVLEPGKPIRSVDALALRDNPVAIAGGASGAPRVQTAAIQDAAVTTAKLSTGERMTTANVLARTAGASAGAVGTYAFARRNSTISAGTTYAGSGLNYHGARIQSTSATITMLNGTVGSALSGTWRAMGHQGTTDVSATTLFLRIS
jgi:hypothetical protein